MRVFSTFTGIGGFEIGIHNAYRNTIGAGSSEAESDLTGDRQGHRDQEPTGQNTGAKGRRLGPGNNDGADSRPLCVGYSEIDPYAIKVFERNFQGVKNYGDITTIKTEELPDFDCLVGGFPCQAFSLAGLRRGFDDTRGTLFFDLARILRAKQPRLFVFENVKGLLSHDRGRTFKTIIATIDELGYDAQWQVVNSKNFGTPQNRDRVIIVGHLRGTPRPEVFPFTGTSSKAIVQLNAPVHSNDRIYAPEGIGPTLNTMQGGNRQPIIAFSRDGSAGTEEADTTRVRKTASVPRQLDRMSDTQRYKMAGNAVTTNVIQAVFERIFQSVHLT